MAEEFKPLLDYTPRSYHSTTTAIESDSSSAEHPHSVLGLTSVPASVQSGRSVMVAPTNTPSLYEAPPIESQPSRVPDFIDSQHTPGSHLITPDQLSVQVHGPCTEESTEAPYPTPNSITVISTRVTAYQRVKTQVKTHPVLCTVWSVCSIFGICLIVGCIAIAVLVDPCSSYSAVNIVYSFDILLVDPNIDASCHTELLLQEVASKMNAREQDLQIFAGKCGDIPEYRDTIYHPQYGYTNFTGSFGIYGSTYFTVNSNVTVAINASTPHEKSSKVIVCLFDNQTSFFEFSTNQEKWKEYIQYAMLCNSTVVSTSKPTVETVFTFNFETQGYYSLGIASYELISYLDEVVSGERFLYNTTNLTRVNCSLHTYSAPACRLPLSSIDSNPCLLVRAVPPVDDETGFSGLQITSDSDSTPQHSGWTIGLLALAGIIFLCLVVLLVVVLKKIVCR